jgi:hypothetical protein
LRFSRRITPVRLYDAASYSVAESPVPRRLRMGGAVFMDLADMSPPSRNQHD